MQPKSSWEKFKTETREFEEFLAEATEFMHLRQHDLGMENVADSTFISFFCVFKIDMFADTGIDCPLMNFTSVV